MGKRNWTSVVYDTSTGDLAFDIRVEFERGAGVTTGCVFEICSLVSPADDDPLGFLSVPHRPDGEGTDVCLLCMSAFYTWEWLDVCIYILVWCMCTCCLLMSRPDCGTGSILSPLQGWLRIGVIHVAPALMFVRPMSFATDGRRLTEESPS
jgi:hypothetical protein